MRYDVEQEIDEHWYSVFAPSDSDSAAQAVAHAALSEGLYRARPSDPPGADYQLFRVPARGRPTFLGMISR
jgi:hypothetical protein